MSSRGLRGHPVKGHARNSRRKTLIRDVDLNALPVQNRDEEGTSTRSNSQDVQAGQQGVPVQPPTIDVEALDDDVIISSPRTFAEAKYNARKKRGRTVVLDVDSGEQTSRFPENSRNGRKRVSPNQTIINCDHLYINLEGSSHSMREKNVCSIAPPPQPPPPKEPTFSCPICMGQLVEEMSTKCGHIFCKACLKAAISAQSKCPTCRKKMTMKDAIRVYLPATR